MATPTSILKAYWDKIKGINAKVDTKASQTDLNALISRVATLEAQMLTTAKVSSGTAGDTLYLTGNIT
jgi:hypothetical protein